MTKFGEEYSFQFIEVKKFFRVPVSCSDDQCFLNVGKNSVVKIQDQKPLHTWTLMHPHYFTCPVVYDNGNLYCIMDYNVLLKWSVNEESLKRAEKVKFQESVFAILSIHEQQPVILFSSGKYVIIDTDNFSNLKPSEFEILKDDEDLLWADATVSTPDIKIFCLTYSEKEQQYVVYNFIANKDGKESNVYSYILCNPTATLKNWCLNKHRSFFLSVWSDGMVQQHRMKDSKQSTLIPLKDIENNSLIAIDSIDSSHIVVAKGILQHKECILEIWDTKFSVLKTQKRIKTPCLENLQIAALNSKVFLCFNKDLTLISYNVEQSTLAAAVGKSLAEPNKTMEFSWDTEGKVIEIPNEVEPMDVTEAKDETSDPIELIAQKLLHQNSQYLMYIPESELAKLLQLALKYHKENSNKKYTKKEAYIILNIVFSASFNDIFLVKYLKRMNLDETLIVLELLLSYLNHTIDLPSTTTDKPSDLQIVNWMCLIIQSHMEALLFSKDKKSRSLLKKLEKAISVKMEEYEDFESIKNYFSILQKKNILPEKCSTGKYSIETIDM